MTIVRWVLLAVTLVSMGLATVWWKTQTLSAGYQAARDQRRLAQIIEEERVESARLARITAPAQVVGQARELKLVPGAPSNEAALALLRGEGKGNVVAMVGPGGRPRRLP